MNRYTGQTRDGAAAGVRYALFRLLLACGMFALAIPVVRMAEIETLRQQVNGLMTTIKRHNWGSPSETLRDDLVRLRELAERVEQSPLGRRYLQATVADARALELDYPAGGTALSGDDDIGSGIDRISEAYSAATLLTPRDPYLIARHARVMARTSQFGLFDELLERAATLGPADYNTIRQVIYLGISKWPRLSCSTRLAVLRLIDAGLHIDDSILARWNTDLGQRRVAETLQTLFDRYDFDLEWAKVSVTHCD